jgi:hypothetical protein
MLENRRQICSLRFYFPCVGCFYKNTLKTPNNDDKKIQNVILVDLSHRQQGINQIGLLPVSFFQSIFVTFSNVENKN